MTEVVRIGSEILIDTEFDRRSRRREQARRRPRRRPANGGAGADTLIGGAGDDWLMGGADADTFVFQAAGAANGVDYLADFTHGADALQFDAADYGFSPGHVLTSSEFTVGASAVGSSAQFVWNATSRTLSWDANGAGGAAPVKIAAFAAGATLTAADLHF